MTNADKNIDLVAFNAHLKEEGERKQAERAADAELKELLDRLKTKDKQDRPRKRSKAALKTSFMDASDPAIETESRPWHVHSQTVEHPSSVVYFIDCPFCKSEVKAYLWSLSGGGKRCECGAIFSHWGKAHRRVAQEEEETDADSTR